MPTPAAGTVGSLDYTPEERKVLARKSKSFECQICGSIGDKLMEDKGHKLGGNPLTAEESTLLKQISLKGEEDNNRLQEKGEEIGSPEIVESPVSEESEIRQRLVVAENIIEAIVEPHDSLLQASIQRSNR